MLFYLAAYLTLNPAITTSSFSAKTPNQTSGLGLPRNSRLWVAVSSPPFPLFYA
jgi:hypothetical protein